MVQGESIQDWAQSRYAEVVVALIEIDYDLIQWRRELVDFNRFVERGAIHAVGKRHRLTRES